MSAHDALRGVQYSLGVVHAVITTALGLFSSSYEQDLRDLRVRYPQCLKVLGSSLGLLPVPRVRGGAPLPPRSLPTSQSACRRPSSACARSACCSASTPSRPGAAGSSTRSPPCPRAPQNPAAATPGRKRRRRKGQGWGRRRRKQAEQRRRGARGTTTGAADSTAPAPPGGEEGAVLQLVNCMEGAGPGPGGGRGGSGGRH